MLENVSQLRASLLSLAHLSSCLCVPDSVSPTYFPCSSFLPSPLLTIHSSSYSRVFQGITPTDCRKWEQMNRDGYSCWHVLWNICCIGKYSQLQRSGLKFTIAERVLWEDKGCHIWENDQCWLAPVSEPFLWVWHCIRGKLEIAKAMPQDLYHLLWNRTCALGLLDSGLFHNRNCVDGSFSFSHLRAL